MSSFSYRCVSCVATVFNGNEEDLSDFAVGQPCACQLGHTQLAGAERVDSVTDGAPRACASRAKFLARTFRQNRSPDLARDFQRLGKGFARIDAPPTAPERCAE